MLIYCAAVSGMLLAHLTEAQRVAHVNGREDTFERSVNLDKMLATAGTKLGSRK